MFYRTINEHPTKVGIREQIFRDSAYHSVFHLRCNKICKSDKWSATEVALISIDFEAPIDSHHPLFALAHELCGDLIISKLHKKCSLRTKKMIFLAH